MIIAAAGVLVLTGRLDSRKIADGVSISGLSLGGMSRNTAASAIRDAFDPASHDLVLTANGSTLRLQRPAQRGTPDPFWMTPSPSGRRTW